MIVAAGSGSRMGGPLPKQFLPLAGVPVLVRTVRKFREILPLARLIVVLPADLTGMWNDLCREWDLQDTHLTCPGGSERTESVRNALDLADGCRWIAVHDGVRPLFSAELVRRTLAEAMQHGNAIPVTPLVDSLREITPEGSRPIDRSALCAVQTPQIFAADTLKKAYAAVDLIFTDDATVVEHAGVTIHVCQGERRNLKITTPEDLAAAAAWLNE